MKKSILIFCAVLTTFSLSAFAYLNWNNIVTDHEEISCSKTVVFDKYLADIIYKPADLNLFYRVRNRWSTITKEELHKAKSILDIIRNDGTYKREAFRNVRVSILHNDKDVRDVKVSEVGQSEVLNTAQLNLLHSSDYSTNIRITALNRRTNTRTGVIRDDSLVHYMTIIPEKEAVFTGGHEALIEYLKESSKEKTAIIEREKLQPGKVHFTVTKEGTIANVKVTSTSGYPSVDKELVKILSNMPKNWSPATNSKGEKVDQELVFFFGLEGC